MTESKLLLIEKSELNIINDLLSQGWEIKHMSATSDGNIPVCFINIARKIESDGLKSKSEHKESKLSRIMVFHNLSGRAIEISEDSIESYLPHSLGTNLRFKSGTTEHNKYGATLKVMEHYEK